MRPNFGNPISKTSQGRSRFFNFCFLFQKWHFLIHRIEEKLLEARRCKEAPGLNPLPNCFPSLDTLGKDSCAKSDEFSEKFQGGGGAVIFNPKFMLQILRTLNRAFWAWNCYKRVTSGSRVCFFQQLSTPTPHPSKWSLSLEIMRNCSCISYYLAFIPPYIYATISIIKNCNIIFPKIHPIW